jgi:hypothetical protein
MTPVTSRDVSNLMLSVGKQLANSVREVKKSESETEFLRYRASIAKLLATMQDEILTPLYSEHPELKPDGLR